MIVTQADIIHPVSIPSNTGSNIEELQQIPVIYCPQCVTYFGDILISIMVFTVFIILPMIEITFGLIYHDECSMNFYIPIYLIVAGAISITILVFAIDGCMFVYPLMDDLKLKTIKSILSESSINSKINLSIAIVFLLIGFIWFIIGNVWIFNSQLKVQYTDPIGNPNTYCNRNIYLCGFWSIIIKYILAFTLSCRLNCYMCNDIRTTIKNAQVDSYV